MGTQDTKSIILSVIVPRNGNPKNILWESHRNPPEFLYETNNAKKLITSALPVLRHIQHQDPKISCQPEQDTTERNLTGHMARSLSTHQSLLVCLMCVAYSSLSAGQLSAFKQDKIDYLLKAVLLKAQRDTLGMCPLTIAVLFYPIDSPLFLICSAISDSENWKNKLVEEK